MLKTNLLFNKNGPQLQSNKTQPSFHSATVITEHQVSTAKSQIALVPTDQRMDQQELHALELSQPLSHTTTPTQLPVDHMPPQETLHQTQATQSRPFIQSQHQLSFNFPKNQLPPQPPLPLSQLQRRSQSLTQRLPRPTPLSMDKSEVLNKSKISRNEKLRG
jgi:hypothetical protein